MPRPLLRAGAIGTALALFVAGLVLFGPPGFGSPLSSAVITGNSMEPALEERDLVVLRQQSTYQVGEIIGYEHPSLGLVIHRVVAREVTADGLRLTIQGDNNSWIDSYQPGSADVVGTVWFGVPVLGQLFNGLRSPRIFAIIASTAALAMVLGPAGGADPKDRRRRRISGGTSPPAGTASWRYRVTVLLGAPGLVAFGSLAVLLVSSILVLGYALQRDSDEPLVVETPYAHTGTFTYATLTPSAIYDDGVASSGAPIFWALTDRVAFNFDYEIEVADEAIIGGESALYAEISNPSGWTRRLPVTAAESFRGTTAFHLDGVLLASDIEAAIALFQEETGLTYAVHDLSVFADLEIAGSVDGQEFTDAIAPALSFRFSERGLEFVRGVSEASPFDFREGGVIPVEETIAATASIVGWNIAVSDLRRLASVAFYAAALGLVALLALVQLARRSDAITRIHAQYRSRLRAGYLRAASLKTTPQVRLDRIEDLVAVAEQAGVPVVWEERDLARWYFVVLPECIYLFSLAPLDDVKVLPRQRAA